MSTQQPPYPLRISPEMRDRLQKIADGNGRSLAAEILARLEASLSESGDTIDARLENHEKRLAALESKKR